MFLLTKYVMALKETKMEGRYFIWVLAHKENVCLSSCKDCKSVTY